MSREGIAAFLRRLPKDDSLRRELTTIANRHGFQFTPDELRDVDIEGVIGSMSAIDVPPAGLPDLPENDDDDDPPGFGVIEVPA
jgi:hypothetical protein